MRQVTLDCDVCGTRMTLEKAKEALIKTGENKYHLMDLCTRCLDEQLKNASSVNDADGYRKRAAALITPRDGQLPKRREATEIGGSAP